jgi:hypothetical protein
MKQTLYDIIGGLPGLQHESREAGVPRELRHHCLRIDNTSRKITVQIPIRTFCSVTWPCRVIAPRPGGS